MPRPPKKAPPPRSPSKKTTAPVGWSGFTDRGNERQAAGDLEGAVADFTAAMGLAPDEVAPRLSRGNARALKGDLEGAFADYTEAVRLAPEMAQAYQRRGLTRQRMGDLEGAMRDLDTAIRLDPAEPLAYGERAALRALLGDFDGATEDAKRALEMAPADWKHRASTLSLMGTLRAAQERSKRHTLMDKDDKQKPGKKKKVSAKDAPPSDAAVVEEVLEEAGWDEPERHEEPDGFITYIMRSDDGDPVAATIVRVSETLARVVVYLLYRESAKKARRAQAAEFVARANWGLGDGNFEIDLDSGEIRYKITINYTGIDLSPLLVRNMIVDAMDMNDVYGEALGSVLSGAANAAEAIIAAEAALEGDEDEEEEEAPEEH